MLPTATKLREQARKRASDYVPLLQDLRKKYPTLADHWLLVLMYLEVKDKLEGRVSEFGFVEIVAKGEK